MKYETRNKKKIKGTRFSRFFFPVSLRQGFTLVEIVVGTALFLIVALAAYNSYIELFKLVNLSQYRVLATALANEQFEIARNMPYADVGVQGSIPKGKLLHTQTISRGGTLFEVTTIVRNIDLAFDGTIGGTPNDLSPADNKLVEITVSCDGCNNMQPVTISGEVAPKNLESASTNGALFVRVFDANGQPVQGADVHVVNVATTTTIVIDDVTGENGMLQLVDVPPDANAYRITVSKEGYSTDRTYPVSVGNPIPTKPDATVLVQQVTQASFAIDKVSTVNISSVTPTCTPIGNFSFSLTGGKEIGAGIPKYDQNLVTDAGGIKTLSSMEWDSYTMSATDAAYDLIGVNPLNPLVVNPDSSINFQLILAPKDPKILMVTVKDSVTQLPLSDATVNLTGPGGYDETFTTGRGYINQTDWSGGSGQETLSNKTKYFSDDGNVDVSTSSGQVVLREAFGQYNLNGYLESSTFDSGSPSNFYSLIREPTDQPPLAGADSVYLQFATNATVTPTTTWAFKGPDGTVGTFYTSANSSLSASHNGDRFARYRLYLATQTATVTPNVSDVSFTYTSNCVPPGQVVFSGLSSGTYTINVSKTGYSPTSVPFDINQNWQEQQILLGP